MSDQAIEQSQSTTDQLEQLAAAVQSDEPAPSGEPEDGARETESTESEPSGQAEEQPQEVQKFTVRIKGDTGEDVEQEVTLDELRSGYLRQADYTRKTERVAREREQFQAQASQAIAGELSRQRGELERMQAMVWHSVAPELQNVDWPKLAQEDPAQWAALQAKAQQFQAVMGSLDQRLNEVRSVQARQAEAHRQEYLVRAAERLKADGFTNETYQSSIKAGHDYGFSAEEMNALADPRWITVLRDAAKYREIGKAKPLAEKKVAEAPPVLKPGAASANHREQAVEQARARLKKSGSVRDLAAAMRSMNL